MYLQKVLRQEDDRQRSLRGRSRRQDRLSVIGQETCNKGKRPKCRYKTICIASANLLRSYGSEEAGHQSLLASADGDAPGIRGGGDRARASARHDAAGPGPDLDIILGWDWISSHDLPGLHLYNPSALSLINRELRGADQP